MTMARNLLCLAALAAAVAAGGCGPSSTTSASSASASPPASAAPVAQAALPNACDVLTDAVARKYLGDGAQLKRKAQTNAQMSQCQYGSDKGVITVMVGPWFMLHTTNPTEKPAAGLGDEAYSSPGGLYVRKGDHGVSIDVIVSSGEYWGVAAEGAEARMEAAEAKVAPDLLARL
jgi:hypothetical protein